MYDSSQPTVDPFYREYFTSAYERCKEGKNGPHVLNSYMCWLIITFRHQVRNDDESE